MNKHLVFDSREEAEKAIPANSIRKIRIDNKLYALANVASEFKAFQINCPHSGADLSTGKINYLGEVVCPLHSYAFNFLDGEEISRRCPAISTYVTIWEEGKLYVLI